MSQSGGISNAATLTELYITNRSISLILTVLVDRRKYRAQRSALNYIGISGFSSIHTELKVIAFAFKYSVHAYFKRNA